MSSIHYLSINSEPAKADGLLRQSLRMGQLTYSAGVRSDHGSLAGVAEP